MSSQSILFNENLVLLLPIGQCSSCLYHRLSIFHPSHITRFYQLLFSIPMVTAVVAPRLVRAPSGPWLLLTPDNLLHTFPPTTLKRITHSSVISISPPVPVTPTYQVSAPVYTSSTAFTAIPKGEVLSPFYIRGNWGLKSLSGLPKVVTGKLWRARSISVQSTFFFFFFLLCNNASTLLF